MEIDQLYQVILKSAIQPILMLAHVTFGQLLIGETPGGGKLNNGELIGLLKAMGGQRQRFRKKIHHLDLLARRGKLLLKGFGD